MRKLGYVAAALLVAACGGKDGGNASTAASGPVKHQPGSWTNKITITKLDAGPGVDTTKIKEGMQQMFDAVSSRSVCITPEMAAKDNPANNMKQLAAQGKKCDFTRQVAEGEKLDFAGVCTDANGMKMKIAMTGTNTPTALTMNVASEPADQSGPMKGSMEMSIASTRTGECKPGDLTPPMPGNSAG